MKILIISVITPFPIDTGGNAGTFKLLDHARKENDITFISLPSEKVKIDGLKANWPNVRILTKEKHDPILSTKEKIKAGVKSIIRNTPKPSKLLIDSTNLVDGFYEEFVKEIVTLTTQEVFDIIQVEYIELAPIVYFLPKDTPTVFIHHELRYRRMEYEYGLMTEKRLSDSWKIQTTKELELGLMNRYTKVCTVSEDDKQYLIESGVDAKKVVYSPSPVEFVNRSINIPFQFANKLIYLGPEAHYPNEDGVRWFLQDCWPSINKKHPELDFQIVGKWTEETKSSIPSHNKVKFLGFVADLASVFEGAILLVPLRIGGGMRMKILEAISWNTPIITTTIGAEGLPMIHKENCFIADTPVAFNEALESIISNVVQVNEIISSAHKALGLRFSIKNCAKVREGLYQEILNK
jgi:glycosyltransferase involved in cell wall biosynthesis